MNEIEVRGLKELRDVLMRKLPIEIQGRPIQSALGKAARPIVKTARQLAPEDTGRLKRAIYSYKARESTRTRQVRHVGVRTGRKAGNKDAFYWRFVEFGHRTGAKKGQYLQKADRRAGGRQVAATGFVRAQPFMRPAFDTQKEKAVAVFRDELAGLIDKAARKYEVKP